MPLPALPARQHPPHRPHAAALRLRLAPAALLLWACGASGLAQAGAPPMVVVQPTLSVVEPAQAMPPAAAPAPGTGAAAVVVVDAPALAAASTHADAAQGAPDAAATPWLPATAAAQHAAELPRSALAGLPVLAMLVGAALVLMGWRRARR